MNPLYRDCKATFLMHDVPMLIRSFQIAENQWAIKECLAAACSLCEDRESRLSLLRHGILAAVQRSVLQSSLMEVQNRAQHSAESPTAPAMCASLLASFSRCHASRISLCENPQTALLLVNVLRTFLAAQCEREVNRAADEIMCSDLLSALSAATESPSSQHALLAQQHQTAEFEANTSIPVFVTVTGFLRMSIKQLFMRSESSEPHELTFDLIQSALEVLNNLGSYDPTARSVLRAAGTTTLCLSIIAAIRDCATRHRNQMLGTGALASAVSTLRLVSTVAGQVEPNSLHGIPIIYDVLRSQLSKPRIQQEGLQLLYVLCCTCQGASRLDDIPGSWQWLGRTQYHDAQGPRAWAITQNIQEQSSLHWNATHFAAFLSLRGLKQDSCNELQRNIKLLVVMALLPFEGEAPRAWLERVSAYQTRNRVCLLGAIVPKTH